MHFLYTLISSQSQICSKGRGKTNGTDSPLCRYRRARQHRPLAASSKRTCRHSVYVLAVDSWLSQRSSIVFGRLPLSSPSPRPLAPRQRVLAQGVDAGKAARIAHDAWHHLPLHRRRQSWKQSAPAAVSPQMGRRLLGVSAVAWANRRDGASC
jgi:hypothetical protein